MADREDFLQEGTFALTLNKLVSQISTGEKVEMLSDRDSSLLRRSRRPLLPAGC